MKTQPYINHWKQCSPCGDIHRTDDLHATANSYLGLMRHASSHKDRSAICNVASKRGHSVAAYLTKIYEAAK